jgi:mannitol/fructose-specific phosphotransferase system IIA component (Ntr-type)
MNNHELAVIKKDFTELLILDLEGVTREEVFMNISGFVEDKGLVKDAKIPYEKFLEQERLSPATIGNGILLPEAYGIEMARPYAFILCRTRFGLECCTSDGEPVRIILATLVGVKKDMARFRTILRFAKALRSKGFQKVFLKAKTEFDVYQALAQHGISQLKKTE